MNEPPGHWPSSRTRALDWLIQETAGQPFFDNLFGELCRHLVDDGLPLDRATVHLRTLHPQYAAGAIRWEPEYAEAEMRMVDHSVLASDRFMNSPMRAIFAGEVGGIRQRLDIPIAEGAPKYGIYDDLRAAGFVDYVVMPMHFVTGNIHCATWATKRAGGFTTAELRGINDIMPVMALALEVRLNRRISKNLLNTYVGTRAGERILAGDITRGSGETITAAVWYCDLRSFTSLSEAWPRERLITSLNEYFDVMAEPVLERGGEILKFMGDGMLAIFPLEGEAACMRALSAALAARKGMRELNERRRERGDPEIGFGLVLHVGDVMWGNIGATSRLDFTVIGPAVNVASRLDGLTKELRREFLISGEFASICEGLSSGLTRLGSYPLRGVEKEIEVFAPLDDR